MASDDRSSLNISHLLVWAWGVLGFVALLARAIWALTPLALAPLHGGELTAVHGVVFAVWLVFMGYSEAYRGFHCQMSPRVVVRGLHLARNPRFLHVLLAPLYCMGLIHATRKRLIVAWSVAAGIVMLIIAVHFVPQPWRGIIDGGVVLGLCGGIASVLWFFFRALAGVVPKIATDIPVAREASGTAAIVAD